MNYTHFVRSKKLIFSLSCFTIWFFLSGCGPDDPTHVSLIGKAQSGQWLNDAGENLQFGDKSNNAKGFARIVNAQLEDGIKYDILLETHPHWVTNGSIEGHYKMTIPAGCSLRAIVGFIKGATTSDGVTFQVYWRNDNPPANNPPITALQGELFKPYSNHLSSFIIDLRGIAGQTGELILKVKAGEGSGQDWAVWQTAAIAPYSENDDIDKDGVSDEKENALLQDFSPYYKFSKESIHDADVEEQYLPTDAIWYVQHSDLLYGGDQNAPIVFTSSQLMQNAGMFTNAQWKQQDGSSIISTPKKSDFRLNIDDDYRSGFHNGDGHDWPEVQSKGNIGLYGHVTPLSNNNYRIEYWQFFGFNQGNAFDVKAANHEGDWCTVSVIYNETSNSLTSVQYAHHGDITERLIGPGKNHLIETSGDGLTQLFEEDDFDVVRNFIEFYSLPSKNVYKHPVVYVEWGSHEFWPRPAGDKTSAPNHDGDGLYHYLTHDVPNLGEVENPMDAASGLVTQFNGFWGAWNQVNSNPPGIELHTEWNWPSNSNTYKAIPHGDFEN